MTTPAKRFNRAALNVQRIFEQNKLARASYKSLSSFFKAQGEQVLKELEALKPYFDKAPDTKTNATPPILEDWDRIWADIAQNSTDGLQKIILGAEQSGMEAGFKSAPKMMGIDASKRPGTTFNLENPRAVKWFERRADRLITSKEYRTPRLKV